MRKSFVEIPKELRPAEEVLEQYGRWAQDRYKKEVNMIYRLCKAAELEASEKLSEDREPLMPFIADFKAMEVQRCLQEVDLKYRRVLFAIYVPKAENSERARVRMGYRVRHWELDRLNGLREFWKIYQRKVLQCAKACV